MKLKFTAPKVIERHVGASAITPHGLVWMVGETESSLDGWIYQRAELTDIIVPEGQEKRMTEIAGILYPRAKVSVHDHPYRWVIRMVRNGEVVEGINEGC